MQRLELQGFIMIWNVRLKTILGSHGSEGFTHFLYSDHWAMLCWGLTLQTDHTCLLSYNISTESDN